jgi:hypothetical protein
MMPVLVEVLSAATCAQSTNCSGGEWTCLRPEEGNVEETVTMQQYVRKVLEAALTYEVSSRGNILIIKHETWRDEVHESMCGFLREWSERCADSGNIVQPLSAIRAYLQDVHDRKVPSPCHLMVASAGASWSPVDMYRFSLLSQTLMADDAMHMT